MAESTVKTIKPRKKKIVVHPFHVDIRGFTPDAPIGGKLLASYENPSDIIVALSAGPGAGTIRVRFDQQNGCIAILAESSLQIIPQYGNKVLVIPDNIHTNIFKRKKMHHRG